MAKFIYKGPAAETDAFGIVFPKGKPVDVTDEHAVKKLTNNPCFTSGKKEAEQPKE